MPAFRTRFVVVGALLTALMVAGCDAAGPTITRVAHDGSFDVSIITSGGPTFPAVIHGQPFPEVDGKAVAAALRMPPGFSQEFRFAPAAPDDSASRDGHRLVLVFNRSDTVDAFRDCRTQGVKQTLPPKSEGYTLTLTLCGRDRAIATAHLEAPRRTSGDRVGFERDLALIMTVLLKGPER